MQNNHNQNIAVSQLRESFINQFRQLPVLINKTKASQLLVGYKDIPLINRLQSRGLILFCVVDGREYVLSKSLLNFMDVMEKKAARGEAV